MTGIGVGAWALLLESGGPWIYFLTFKLGTGCAVCFFLFILNQQMGDQAAPIRPPPGRGLHDGGGLPAQCQPDLRRDVTAPGPRGPLASPSLTLPSAIPALLPTLLRTPALPPPPPLPSYPPSRRPCFESPASPSPPFRQAAAPALSTAFIPVSRPCCAGRGPPSPLGPHFPPFEAGASGSHLPTDHRWRASGDPLGVGRGEETTLFRMRAVNGMFGGQLTQPFIPPV